MSELSNKIKSLRGTLSAEDAGEKCGLSRESFYRMERGGTVKIDTLRDIAKGFKLSEDEWLDLLAAWLKMQAGDDGLKLFIERKGHSTKSKGSDSEIATAMTLFTNLTPDERQEILNAMRRPEVRACLPAINSVWDKLKPARGN